MEVEQIHSFTTHYKLPNRYIVSVFKLSAVNSNDPRLEVAIIDPSDDYAMVERIPNSDLLSDIIYHASKADLDSIRNILRNLD